MGSRSLQSPLSAILQPLPHGFPLSALKVIRGTAVKLAAGRPLSGEFWPSDGKPVRNFAINAWIDGTETGLAAIVTRNIATLHTFWD